MTQLKLILFLSKLVKSTDGQVGVFTDNLSVHHGKKVAAWVKAQAGTTELEFIPGYSPELNADESLNRDLRKNVNARKTPGIIKEIKENILSLMRSLQKQPARVMKEFSGRHIEDANQCF